MPRRDLRQGRVEALALVRADVEDDVGEAEAARRCARCRAARRRSCVDLGSSSGEVDEVDGVATAGPRSPRRQRAEPLRRPRPGLGEAPGPRALREHLVAVAAEVDARARGARRDPAARRDVRAEEHRPVRYRGRWVSASASPVADGLPPRRWRSHRAVQLAVRPPRGRRRRAAHRGHRRRARGGRRDRADPGVARLAGPRLRRVAREGRPVRPYLPERAARRVPRGGGPAGRRRRAYPCYRTPEELEAARATARETDDPASPTRAQPRPDGRAGRASSRPPAASR